MRSITSSEACTANATDARSRASMQRLAQAQNNERSMAVPSSAGGYLWARGSCFAHGATVISLAELQELIEWGDDLIPLKLAASLKVAVAFGAQASQRPVPLRCCDGGIDGGHAPVRGGLVVPG
jgi:hypothetical protein